jgi:hypothetical protein
MGKAMTQQDFIDRFEYRDGKLFYKKSEGGMKKGSEAGTVCHAGHLKTLIKRRPHLLHRIIFMMHHGFLPEFLDHIDGNPSNNKIGNLRAATNAQNNWNTGIRKTNTSGVKGVYWDKKYNSWHAQCFINYKNHFLGRYKNIEDAEKAVKDFRSKHHGEFARHK